MNIIVESLNYNIMKVICPICKTKFTPRTKNHVFDKRKCFKIDYNRRLKEKVNIYPTFSCPDCKKATELTFNPKKSVRKWSNFICPYCGYKNNLDY